MKILSPWPWPQGHPWGGDGADKNFRPISTIMPNMNEIHQRIFKIWGLINFNAKTLTLWRKDEWTYERTYVRTNEWTDERKSENYITPHTSYVGGITRSSTDSDGWPSTRSSTDLDGWPSFWPQVTQFQTWPRTHQANYFEQDSW